MRYLAQRRRVLIWFAAVAVVLGFVCVKTIPGQSAPLQITAPASGTVVYPGQTITVIVASSPGIALTGVGVVGDSPIGFSQLLTAPPFHFQVAIPPSITFGTYKLTAIGATPATPAGQPLQSSPISIDVEPALRPTRVSVEPTRLTFRFTGDQLPLLVTGTFADGSTTDMTQSSMTSYGTTNPEVAIVSTTGIVTATGPGTGNIVVNGTVTIPVVVPSAARGDLNGDGKVNLDDLNILEEALNTPAIKPADARDLNRDGVINALDARVLITLCTKPGCARQ
jgi:hypothetical protein